MLSELFAGTLRFTSKDIERVRMFARMPRGAYGEPKQAKKKPVFHTVTLVPFASKLADHVGAEFILGYGAQEWRISHRVAVEDLRKGEVPVQFSMRDRVKTAVAVLNAAAKTELFVWLDMLETQGRIR